MSTVLNPLRVVEVRGGEDAAALRVAGEDERVES
jgi:hypothetical protein